MILAYGDSIWLTIIQVVIKPYSINMPQCLMLAFSCQFTLFAKLMINNSSSRLV